MLKQAVVLVVVASLGCGKSKDADKKEAPPPAQPPAPEQKPPVDEPSAGPEQALQKLSEDLDGDGTPEQIVLARGKLTVGEASVPIEGEFEDIEVAVIDFDGSDQLKEVAVSAWSGEDDLVYSLVRYDGSQLTATQARVSNAHTPGDGTLVDTYANCGQTKITIYKMVDGKLAKDSEKVEGEHNDAECAACPYVFVRGADGDQLVGEILREVRGRDAETTQSLRLPTSAVTDGVLRVRLSELKPETTYVDALYLTVDGHTVRPRTCAGPLCARDADYAVLRRGDSRELVFDVGAVAANATITLWATGYYVPDSWNR